MNTLKINVLSAALSGLLIGIGFFVAGGTGVIIALAISAILNFGSYW